VLVCAGRIGWIGLARILIATAYGQANQQASDSQRLA